MDVNFGNDPTKPFRCDLAALAAQLPAGSSPHARRIVAAALDWAAEQPPGGGAARDALVGKLRTAGVDIPVCGDATIRCRPGLFFTRRHADQFLSILDDTLAKQSA